MHKKCEKMRNVSHPPEAIGCHKYLFIWFLSSPTFSKYISSNPSLGLIIPPSNLTLGRRTGGEGSTVGAKTANIMPFASLGALFFTVYNRSRFSMPDNSHLPSEDINQVKHVKQIPKCKNVGKVSHCRCPCQVFVSDCSFFGM